MFTKYKYHWITLLISTLMYVLMFPVATGGDEWPIASVSSLLAWVFLVPTWIFLRHEKPKIILFFGYLFCFFSTIGTLYWFYIAMKTYGDIAAWESTLILAGAGFLVGTIRWFAFVIASRFQSMKHFPLFAALIFTLTEWSMQYIPFEGFPWITPGYAVFPMRHLVQPVDLFGIHGMNFLIFYTNFLIVEWCIQKRRHEIPSKKPLIIMALVLLMFSLYGVVQIQKYQNPVDQESLNIALLQGNISQDIKWDASEREEIIKTYQTLSIQSLNSNPDLIVWPEASLPQTLNINRQKIDVIPNEIGQTKMVIGAPTWFKKGNKTMFQNSAFTVTGNGDIEHRYDKVRLVPFGEYVPSFGPIPVEKIVPAVAGNFSKGGMNQEISSVKNHPFGLFICFEVLFPNLAQAWVDKGAEFFVSITNDAWFNRSSGPFQHLRFAGMRSIEFRKPIVRSANTGVTTWFDATGLQHESLGLFEKGYVAARIYPNRVRTLYARFPNAVPIILWIITLCIMMDRRKYIS